MHGCLRCLASPTLQALHLVSIRLALNHILSEPRCALLHAKDSTRCDAAGA